MEHRYWRSWVFALFPYTGDFAFLRFLHCTGDFFLTVFLLYWRLWLFHVIPLYWTVFFSRFRMYYGLFIFHIFWFWVFTAFLVPCCPEITTTFSSAIFFSKLMKEAWFCYAKVSNVSVVMSQNDSEPFRPILADFQCFFCH